MDAFESLVAALLRHRGWWTTTSFKVQLTKEEKRCVGRASTPRWEIDVLAYKGATNEVLAVECKSFLDSRGVIFRDGAFEPARRYKLFSDAKLRGVVLRRLAVDLERRGLCTSKPKVTLCLAAGKLASTTDCRELRTHCRDQGWRLLDSAWIERQLSQASNSGYENDVAFVVAKLLLRGAARSL